MDGNLGQVSSLSQPYSYSDSGTLLVSPHSDDIVMSAFHLLQNSILPIPWNLVVVFSQSNHVVNSFVPKPRSEDITGLRLDEDMQFCKTIGARLHILNLPDCAIRHTEAILDPNFCLDFHVVDVIQRKLDYLADILSCNVLACSWPYGSVQHLDHRIVYCAVSRVAVLSKRLLLLFDDQPYSRLPTTNPILDSNGIPYLPLVVPMKKQELDAKHRTMNLYVTQMCDFYHKAIDRPTPERLSTQPSETIWVPLEK